jgi:hypothetical protein
MRESLLLMYPQRRGLFEQKKIDKSIELSQDALKNSLPTQL